MNARLPLSIALASLLLPSAGRAEIIPITALKLTITDTVSMNGKARLSFLAKDAAITKGPSSDPAQISATVDVRFDLEEGQIDMPQGDNWLKNSEGQAQFSQKIPLGGSVKGHVKPGLFAKASAQNIGSSPVDISSAPTGTVYAAFSFMNGGHEYRNCTKFTGCVHKAIGGGTGFKLSCKDGVGDEFCNAFPATTLPTTTSTTLP